MGAGDDKLVFGRINSAFGIKGWVNIQSFTEFDEDLFGFQPLWCYRKGQWQEIQLEEWRRHGKSFVAQIKGCDDRNQADLYARCELGVTSSQVPALGVDDYYWHQLHGLKVYASVDGVPVLLGVIDHLLATGANDVIAVEPTSDSIDQRQRLLPYLPGQVVMQVDLQAGRMDVDWDPEF